VAQSERGLWPVILSSDEKGDEIVWVRGFPVPAKLRAQPGRAALLVIEKSLAEVLR